MLQFLKRFLLNEKAFTSLVRGVAFGAGGAVASGQVPMISAEWGVALMAIGGAIRAGERNPKERSERPRPSIDDG